MNVVITGGTGFLGQALIAMLLREKYHVVAIVRNAKKFEENIKKDIEIIECPLEKIKDLCIDLSGQESIFYHFAWEGASGEDRKNEKIQLNNIEYAFDALRLADRIGCSKFINAGSIMEYEVMKNIPLDGYKPSINNLYCISKLTANFMLKTLAANLGLQYINIIISNVYGPGEKSERFLNNTLRKMMNGEPIEMTEGLQLYDFIYLEDAIHAIMTVGLRGQGFFSYYIGNRKQRTLKEYVIEMKQILESKSELRFGVIPFNGVSLSYEEFDTGSLEKIGVVPSMSFKQGILKTKEWIQQTEKSKEL